MARRYACTMATANDSTLEQMSTADIQSTMTMIKKMIVIGAAFVVVGYLLVLTAGLQEAFAISEALAEDSTKMTLKLGGLGHVLVGIFISLVAIIRTLSLVPHRLGSVID